MLQNLSKIVLKSRIKKNDKARESNFLHWDKINRIALIIDGLQGNSKHDIDQFLSKTNKYFEVFYIELNSKEHSYSDWNCFSKKDETLLKLPKKPLLDELNTKKFDLLINACQANNNFSASVFSYISATVKCNCENVPGDYDLIIKRGFNIDLTTHLEAVVRYIKMIRPAT